MNKFAKRITAVLAAGVLSCSMMVSAFAQQFVDMPDNWTTPALENAVKNGLLMGDGDRIMPDNNITRAQMAAIIVRAFGATETADLSGFVDMSPEKWYYNEFSKAVAMGAFHGDGNKMNPEKFITFQECFTVLSQVFYLIPRYYEADVDILTEKFTDGDQVADWAKEYAALIVQNGYWDGIDGQLLPTTYITRSQFAVLMDNAIKVYVDEPGEYTEFPEGNVMIRTPDVNIKDVVTTGDIILGEGCEDAVMDIKNVTCGRLLIRGGSEITVGGKYQWILLQKPFATLYLRDASFEKIASCKDSMVDFGFSLQDQMEAQPSEETPQAPEVAETEE